MRTTIIFKKKKFRLKFFLNSLLKLHRSLCVCVLEKRALTVIPDLRPPQIKSQGKQDFLPTHSLRRQSMITNLLSIIIKGTVIFFRFFLRRIS